MPKPLRRNVEVQADAKAREITPGVLRRWPLPEPDEGGDKEGRGRALVVGGAPELPGAIILAATAVLRAGAGKLQIATPESIALAIGVAVPEALVVALPQARSGGIDPRAADTILGLAAGAEATLIGPGMVDESATHALLERVLPRLDAATLILDAKALTCGFDTAHSLHGFSGSAILTPHAGEMASLLGIDKAEVSADPLGAARRAARELGAIVALKGAETQIAAPDGEAYANRTGNVGLATSGSGDTLAGIITGLAARGTSPLQAALWGVYLHGAAGERLAKRIGRLGFLARELLDEVPALMAELAGQRRG